MPNPVEMARARELNFYLTRRLPLPASLLRAALAALAAARGVLVAAACAGAMTARVTADGGGAATPVSPRPKESVHCCMVFGVAAIARARGVGGGEHR